MDVAKCLELRLEVVTSVKRVDQVPAASSQVPRHHQGRRRGGFIHRNHRRTCGGAGLTA